jgi:hypothetical protein
MYRTGTRVLNVGSYIQNILRTEYLTYRISYVQNILHTEYLTCRISYIQNILHTECLTYRISHRISCMQNILHAECLASRISYLQNMIWMVHVGCKTRGLVVESSSNEMYKRSVLCRGHSCRTTGGLESLAGNSMLYGDWGKGNSLLYGDWGKGNSLEWGDWRTLYSSTKKGYFIPWLREWEAFRLERGRPCR